MFWCLNGTHKPNSRRALTLQLTDVGFFVQSPQLSAFWPGEHRYGDALEVKAVFEITVLLILSCKHGRTTLNSRTIASFAFGESSFDVLAVYNLDRGTDTAFGLQTRCPAFRSVGSLIISCAAHNSFNTDRHSSAMYLLLDEHSCSCLARRAVDVATQDE